MSHFSVDTDSLRILAQRLQGLRDQLKNAADFAGPNAGAMGSVRVERSVGHFCDTWKQGLGQMDENIDGVVARLKGAAENYESAETGTVSSINSGGW